MSKETYRFKIGSFDCMIVSDGADAYPAGNFFINAPPDRLEQVLRAHGLGPESTDAGTVNVAYNCLVIDTGAHRVLVETGGGTGFSEKTGKLAQNLLDAGVQYADIDTVVISHAHPDHIGGNTLGEGKPAFPEARYVMWREEWDYWTHSPDMSQMTKVDEGLKQFMVAFAEQQLLPLQDRFDLLDGETQIVPGIRALPAPGHTPGHLALSISSDGEQLLYLGDLAYHPIHMEQPDWNALYDHQREKIRTTRRELFGRAASDAALVLLYHIPGLGHIVRQADAYRWQRLKSE